ncbi:MAG: hypothetical protein IJK96_00390 [Bacteroidales bacterium]|nr:hypothetical protein [Bacteroidales bacterium]
MKKFGKLYMLAALLVAGAAFDACTADEESLIAQPEVQKTYTLTVNVGNGADTRTLTEESGSLTASWNADDEVAVYKGEAKVGILKPTAAGATRLKGEVTGVDVNDELTLKFQSDADYSAQEGTLEYIDTHCSAAVATVTVDKIEGSDLYTSDAAFENQQSIFKFNLKYQDEALSVTPLTITAGELTITVAPTEGKSELYVAIPAISEKTDFQFSATSGSDSYICVIGDATVSAGKFYSVDLKMRKVVDLSKLEAAYVAQDGDVLTGKATDKYKISIAAGATVTLRDVDITSFDSEGPKYAGINCIGDATLVIEGENHVKGAYNECSGINIPANFTLTIEGTGKLTAESNGYGAGIGAGYYWGRAGNIIINSGEIVAIGGGDCAGIGAGCEASCGDITINGGTVTATGGREAPGIGSGYHTSCGNITITNGTIEAIGGNSAAGIGAGYEYSSCGIIEIKGGEVTSTGGKQGAGIGSGYYSSSCGNIIISNGTVKAIGGEDGAGIGTGSTWYHGYQSSCGDINISGGTVEATKGGVATYDVGPGNGSRYGLGNCGTVTIGSGITIKDKDGNDAVIYVASTE